MFCGSTALLRISDYTDTVTRCVSSPPGDLVKRVVPKGRYHTLFMRSILVVLD